jgi:hypothetical protein
MCVPKYQIKLQIMIFFKVPDFNFFLNDLIGEWPPNIMPPNLFVYVCVCVCVFIYWHHVGGSMGVS